jgi:ATP-dependent helicase/nuclease subunit B
MTKTLLIGPAGCGKTRALLEAFEKSLRTSNPLEPDTFLIVPSAEHTERVVSLLIQRGLPGFFHKRVTTLSRLITDVFRVPEIPVVSSLTRAIIVRDLLGKNDWEYFRDVKDLPGFVGLLLGGISELKEACVTPAEFRERMNALKKYEPAFGPKYEALAAVYEGYESELKERGLRDLQDTLRIWRERTRKGGQPPVRFKALWLDGFFDFSNLQAEYVRALAALSDEMIVTLTAEEGPVREDAFETIRSTRAMLEEAGFKVEKMKPVCHRTREPALLHLQRNLFGQNIKTGSGTISGDRNGARLPEGITFLDAVGIEGEIELIAREIHGLYASGNYRYSDFAVLFRQVRDYGRVVPPIFERYGIPVEVHERDRLKLSPWIGAVAALLSIFRNGWRREDVLAFVKSGYVRKFGDLARDNDWLSKFEAGSFENGVLEGREAWTAPWVNETALAENGGAGKDKFLGVLLELEAAFLAAETAADHIRLLTHAVGHTFGILEISDDYTPFTRSDASAARRFTTLLEEIRMNASRVGAHAVLFDSFADQFLGLVELDVYSLHERDKNRVQIYDVSLARQKEYRVVFVAGMLERVFPVQIREDPLLSDWERAIMNAGLEHPLQERLPRQSLERYLFYLAVTRASERLYFSYPHIDLEGKESLRSFYLEEVQRLFDGKVPVVKQKLARPYPGAEEAITGREREVAFLGELRERVESGGKIPAEGPPARVPLDKFLRAITPIEAVIGDPGIRTGGFFDVGEASPTRLEEFAKCPYRYFAHHILNLQDPTEDITSRQKGNILHWVLEEYFRDFIRTGNHHAAPEKFVEEKLKEAFQRYPLTAEQKFREDLDRADVKEMLLSVLEKEIEKLSVRQLRPAYVEYGFGTGKDYRSPAFRIRDGEKEIRIRGRIDRIDTDGEGKAGLVVDYKRTAKLDREALAIGTSLQLPLYVLAVEELLKLEPVGGELYSLKEGSRSGFYRKESAGKFSLGISSKVALLEDADFRHVLARTVEFVKRFTVEIKDLKILVRPRDCEKFCPYPALCRIEKWRLPVILQEILEEDKKRGQSPF